MKPNKYLKSFIFEIIFILFISSVIPFFKAYLLQTNLSVISREQYPINYLIFDFILSLVWTFLIFLFQTQLNKMNNKLYILTNLILAIISIIQIILLLQRSSIIMLYNFYSNYMIYSILIGLCIRNLVSYRHTHHEYQTGDGD